MSTATESTEAPGIRAAIFSIVVVGALLVLAAPSLFGAGNRASVALGAVLAAANLFVIARSVRGYLQPSASSSPWLSLSVLKFAVLFFGVWFVVRAGYAKLLPLVVGYGALPIGIVTSQLKAAPMREN